MRCSPTSPGRPAGRRHEVHPRKQYDIDIGEMSPVRRRRFTAGDMGNKRRKGNGGKESLPAVKIISLAWPGRNALGGIGKVTPSSSSLPMWEIRSGEGKEEMEY